MPSAVVSNALLQCSMGVAPSPLGVIPIPTRPKVEGQAVANVMDNKPFVNIKPFGVCSSLANPATASLTTAALGVLTPGPCTPMTAIGPWMPGALTTKIENFPALTDSSKCMCAYGGVVSINVPVAVRTTVK